MKYYFFILLFLVANICNAENWELLENQNNFSVYRGKISKALITLSKIKYKESLNEFISHSEINHSSQFIDYEKLDEDTIKTIYISNITAYDTIFYINFYKKSDDLIYWAKFQYLSKTKQTANKLFNDFISKNKILSQVQKLNNSEEDTNTQVTKSADLPVTNLDKNSEFKKKDKIINDPNVNIQNSRDINDILFDSAVLLFKQKKYNEAESILNDLIKKRKNFNYYYYLGEISEQKKNFSLAGFYYSEAKKLFLKNKGED